VARQTFGKLQRDRDKRAKAAAKREKRQNRDPADEVEEEPTPVDDVPAEKLLEMIAALHERFDDGGISFEDFEEEKASLLARLPVD
jgi:hypothetical protein